MEVNAEPAPHTIFGNIFNRYIDPVEGTGGAAGQDDFDRLDYFATAEGRLRRARAKQRFVDIMMKNGIGQKVGLLKKVQGNLKK